MKFSCEKAVLLHAAGTASRAVSLKTTIPALEGILIQADSELLLTGYNLEIGIQTLCPALIETKGATVVNARLFGEIIRRLPDDMVFIALDGDVLHITCQKTEFHISVIPPEDFPTLPTMEPIHTLSLPENALKSMIGETLFAVSHDESKPIHTGALFEVEEKQVKLVTVDGYRLAIRQEPLENAVSTPFSFVAPGSALSEVEKIVSEEEKPVTISLGTQHITFRMDDTILLSRRLEGEFIDYQRVIQNEHPLELTVNAKELQKSVDRLSLLISEKLKSPLRCTFGENEISMTTSTAIGAASDTCPMEGNGNNLEIGFNNRFLLEILRAVPAETVRLKLSTSVSPCLILPEESTEQKFLYMILPVRLRAES